MKKLFLSAVLPVVLSGAALADFDQRTSPKEVSRESLELLKAMSGGSSAARTYTGTCVTAIAVAKRLESREPSALADVRDAWWKAAGQCRGMANTVCDHSVLAAPREACNRIRAYQAVM